MGSRGPGLGCRGAGVDVWRRDMYSKFLCVWSRRGNNGPVNGSIYEDIELEFSRTHVYIYGAARLIYNRVKRVEFRAWVD